MNRLLCFLSIFAMLSSAQGLEIHKARERPARSSLAPSEERPLPADERPFVVAPEALGISVDGLEEPLAPFTYLSVQFPEDMVSADQIDVEGVVSPLVFWPEVDLEFTWQTPSRGDLLVKGPVMPAQTYKLRLREDLQNAGGTQLTVDQWGAEMVSPALRAVDSGYGVRESLNARPQIRVEFNYPISLADAAEGAWFQDRESRERFPVEVLLNVPDGNLEPVVVDLQEALPDKVYYVRFRPQNALPLGRFFDLVVEGVRDEYSHRGLPYPAVFPVGTTRPLTVDFVSARNFPLETPEIRVKFSHSLEGLPLPPNPLKLTPEVPNLRFRKDGNFLIAGGDFQIPSKYTVTISDKIMGSNGYGLLAPETWGATFHNKRPAVVFPDRLLRQRSSAGLKFAFYQVNTGPLTWKLARIPLDQWAVVESRLREFDKVERDASGSQMDAQGVYYQTPTEPLIEALGLEVLASGEVPASGNDVMELRELSWNSPQQVLSGPVLIEVTGRDDSQRLVGNRATILFGDLAITRKESPSEETLRIAGLADGLPKAGAKISLLDEANQVVMQAEADQDGLTKFPAGTFKGVFSIAAEVGGAVTIQPLSLSDRFPGGYLSSRPREPFHAFTFTDRPLYRPEQTVHFKGFVRQVEQGQNIIPPREIIQWKIQQPYANEVLASGEARLDIHGGWSATWTPPAGAKLGDFHVIATLANVPLGQPARFQIEEFRNPPFSVVCKPAESKTPGVASLVVESQYFHGAPNAGARVVWKAVWFGDSEDGYYSDWEDSEMTRVDLHSENVRNPSGVAEVSGEAVLDAKGSLRIEAVAPFADPGNRANCQVYWRVDVTGPDGQTLIGGANQRVPMDKVLLGIKARGEPVNGQLGFTWDAIMPFGDNAPSAVEASLFKVSTKSVKERLALNVYRYRNSDVFSPAAKLAGVKTGDFDFQVTEPGRYVVVISPVQGAPGFPVSTEIYLPGEGESEIPVESDSAARILQLAGGQNEKSQPWKVGETAVLTTLAPTEGVAWVSVETDRLLETFTVAMKGNTSRIEVPIKPEYEPNVVVSVYVLRPGGEAGLAGEMFGFTNLQVESPTRRLDIQVGLDQQQVEPRQKISGSVKVTSDGAPVDGADLAIYAVDDSILTLGNWSLPSGIVSRFFPNREYAVVTYSALKAYVDGISPSWLTSKGFVVGGGGEDEFGNVAFTRKDFKPLILWLPSVRTNKAGEATFSAEAPDNLTRFRFVAVGQTRQNQFGAGDTTIEVSKSLSIEPALPRFLRVGDDVELRAVVRQNVADSADVSVRVSVSGNLVLTGEPTQKLSATKDAPVVVTFRAKAGEVGTAGVKFEAAIAEKSADAIEVSLPVDEPVILVKEAVAGGAFGRSIDVAKLAPAAWQGARGTFDFAVSTTPWLPKLMGIPYLLEYPHGCFEQKSSRLLVYTHLARLLEYLPNAGTRPAAYAQVIESTLGEFENALLPGGQLPYWPKGSSPDVYVTLQAAWCVINAEAAGLTVPERLSSALSEAIERILEGRTAGSTPSLQAFAFFMLAKSQAIEADPAALAASELYLIRDRMTPEAKALLALGMNTLGLTPSSQARLVSELPSDFSSIAFDPTTFASATRTEALCTWARLAVNPDQDAKALRERLMTLMESSQSLSTQENLWLLVAFNALLESTAPVTLRASALKPKAETLSPNATAAHWQGIDISRLADFAVAGLPAAKEGSSVLTAAYRTPEILTPLVTQGMRLERVIKNLTEPARLGTPEAPLQLGDELLISYRFSSDKPQSFVALEDLLPAGMEVVNPNLALFSQFVGAASEPNAAVLSFSEVRDRQTNLYFNDLPAGASSYAVLARATAVGNFVWPASQIVPMYDARFFGRSPSTQLRVIEK
ncbi:MAG: alpha-2-macroglobulin family protein [Terrimicrobiaceae bacterium]